MIGNIIRKWRVIKGKKENQHKSNKERSTEEKFRGGIQYFCTM
jgi:hypothetical protein